MVADFICVVADWAIIAGLRVEGSRAWLAVPRQRCNFIVNPRILYKGLQMNAFANGRKVLPNNDTPSTAPTIWVQSRFLARQLNRDHWNKFLWSPSLRYRKTPHILIPRCRSLAVTKVICVIGCNPISARQMTKIVLYIFSLRFVSWYVGKSSFRVRVSSRSFINKNENDWRPVFACARSFVKNYRYRYCISSWIGINSPRFRRISITAKVTIQGSYTDET